MDTKTARSQGIIAPDASLVFVYGTLKSGQRNHHVMERIKAKVITQKCFTMQADIFDLGSYPAITINKEANGNVRVYGEVYAVPEVGMKFLDVFEGVPNLYARGMVSCLSMDTEASIIRAEAYHMTEKQIKDRGGQKIPSGRYGA